MQKLKEVADLLWLGDLCPVPDYKNLSRSEADRLATDLETREKSGEHVGEELKALSLNVNSLLVLARRRFLPFGYWFSPGRLPCPEPVVAEPSCSTEPL